MIIKDKEMQGNNKFKLATTSDFKKPTMEVAGSMQSGGKHRSVLLVIFYFLSCKVGTQVFIVVILLLLSYISHITFSLFTNMNKENI